MGSRASFIHVYDLLTQAAEGIGRAQQELVLAAQTEFATLGVKSARLTVDFVLSSTAQTAGVTGPGMGANTLFGFATSDKSDVSKANIVLDIVPILTTSPPSPHGGPAISGGSGGHGPTHVTDSGHGPTNVGGSGGHGPSVVTTGTTTKPLSQTITESLAAVDRLSRLDLSKGRLRAELNGIKKKLDAGDHAGAAAALGSFFQRNPKVRPFDAPGH
jgi:hypothetical protein